MRQISSQVFDGNGKGFSVSQRERAGVRENTPQIRDLSKIEPQRESLSAA
jgi:hypothetical protein